MSDHPVLPDEDTFVIPKSWSRHLHPRRGGAPGPKIELHAAPADVVAPYLERGRANVEKVLAAPHIGPDITARIRAHLNGDPDPLGAAAVATASAGDDIRHCAGVQFVDAWTSAHGVAFAACAFTELCGFRWSTGHGNTYYLDPTMPGSRYVQQLFVGEAAIRMRSLLATASEQDHQQAVERLAEHRKTDWLRLVTAYLIPTQQDWVDACCAAPQEPRTLLLRSLGSAEQLVLLGPSWTALTQADCYEVENLMTLADGVGPAIAPLLAQAWDTLNPNATRRKNLLRVWCELPTDEAFRLLVERRDDKHIRTALLETAERYPVRALRELAAAGEEEMLAAHVRAHPELAGADLPADVREVLERITASLERVPDADLAGLPRVLADPPWLRPVEEVKPLVIKGLLTPEPQMAWADGERVEWGGTVIGHPAGWDENDPGLDAHLPTGSTDPAQRRTELWEQRVADLQSGQLSGHKQVAVFTLGPEELVRPLIRDWFLENWSHSSGTYAPWNWGRVLVARFELDALPLALRYARSRPDILGALVAPFAEEQVAALMADWLPRSKQRREVAEDWLRHHGVAAARLLLPAALGRPGPRRRAAENALRFLAAELGRDTVLAPAREHSDSTAAAVGTLLGPGAGAPAPRKIPEVGPFADPAALPQVLLNGRERALPDGVVPHLLTTLAMSTPQEPGPGLEEILQACDSASLATFGWALFERWRDHGERAADAWALTALGLLGDDDVARRLTPIIRAWPGENGHHKAVKGLDTLALIGSEAALTLLDGIAQKAKFKAIKIRAQEKMREVAAKLGLTAEQLGDRLVPGFGLDATGSMTLDYGSRRFTVGFDEQLRPFVMDEDGPRRKSLPKPAAKDDPDLAPAAYAAFAQLKKEVRTVAADRIRRLEQAMVHGRHWTPEEFTPLFVEHPLIWHIARRLVWATGTGAFRIAEDRTFADAADEPFTLPDSAEIRLAHPLLLGDQVAVWTEVFADYELTQPFQQLGRVVYELTDEQRKSARLARFEGLNVPFGKVLGLERHGWRRGTPMDNGTERWISRPVPGGRHVVIDLDPGIQIGMVDLDPEQNLNAVWLADEPGDFSPWNSESHHLFGELDPVTASEVLAELAELEASAK